MNSKIISLLGLGVAVLGVLYLFNQGYLFSENTAVIAIQVCSAALMIWARITFGVRSFHAAANTTKGGLVTTGPYRWLRHPIYASIIYFCSACIIVFPIPETIGAVALIIIGLFIRMLLEEKFLRAEYPEYATYCKKAKRLIPFVF